MSMRPWSSTILSGLLLCIASSCGGDGAVANASSDSAAVASDDSRSSPVDAVDDVCLGSASLQRVWLAVGGLPETMLGLEPVTYQGKKSTFHWAVPSVDWTIEVHVVHGGPRCPTQAPKLTWQRADGGGNDMHFHAQRLAEHAARILDPAMIID